MAHSISVPIQDDEKPFYKKEIALKIDSSQINLSTRGQYLETIHARRETRLEFLSLIDGRIQIKNSVQEQDKTRMYEWSETRTIDSAQVTANPEEYGQALFSAYEYYSMQIGQAESQNGTVYEQRAIDARYQWRQTQMQYIEYAPMLELTGNMGDLDLFQRTNLSGAEQERKELLIKESNAEAARIRENAVQVTQTLTGDTPVYEGPDSLLQDIEQMTRLIEKIGQALAALSNDVDSETQGSDLKNIRLDWANINPKEQDDLHRGGYVYDYEERTRLTRHEKKNINFLANGLVNTEDGRQIDFSLALNFEQEVFESSLFIEKEEGYVFIDPLVINLDGNIPQLSEAQFTFDLDADGETEEIRMLAQGSGFLCLDKNNDGIINDGSELFGPGTGNGFLELLSYDEDQNLWIDENDEVFDELSFWENDGTGNMQLTKIKDAGIGAIYLANSDTPIEVMDDENNVQARIKKSGLALNEDGSVASVVEMDWLA